MKNLLPNASADSRRLNPHLFGVPNCVLCGKKPHPDSVGHSYLPPDHKDYKNALQGNVAHRRGIRKGMNKTESEFALILEAQKRRGEILRYEYEGITLRWQGIRYTPDFVVFISSDPPTTSKLHSIKLIEVKGPFIKGKFERAIERFRHARTYWPEFAFELHQKTKGGWNRIA